MVDISEGETVDSDIGDEFELSSDLVGVMLQVDVVSFPVSSVVFVNVEESTVTGFTGDTVDLLTDVLVDTSVVADAVFGFMEVDNWFVV